MNCLPIAVACLASMPLFAALAAADEPTSRPINQLDSAASMADYGVSRNIVMAPLAAGRLPPTPIEAYLMVLQTRIPHFRYIVHRLPGVADPGPMLPEMDTTDLTLGEFVNFVNARCPSIQIEPDKSVDGTDPLYVVNLSPSAPVEATETRPHTVRAVSVRAAVQVQERVRPENAKAAMADVLSLVQAIVDESPDGRSVKLKVHEATSMLIFDGPAALGDTVAAAIDTMGRLTDDERSLLLAGLAGPQKGGPPEVPTTRSTTR